MLLGISRVKTHFVRIFVGPDALFPTLEAPNTPDKPSEDTDLRQKRSPTKVQWHPTPSEGFENGVDTSGATFSERANPTPDPQRDTQH